MCLCVFVLLFCVTAWWSTYNTHAGVRNGATPSNTCEPKEAINNIIKRTLLLCVSFASLPGIRTTESEPKQLTQTQICISACIVGVLFLSRFVSLPTRICSISTTLGARRRASLRKDSCPERLTQVDHSPTRSRPPFANWPMALQATDFSFVGWLHRVKLLLPCEPKS